MGSPGENPREAGGAAGAADLTDPAEAARYIGRITSELRRLAETANLPFLVYLLSMVEEEAMTGGGGS